MASATATSLQLRISFLQDRFVVSLALGSLPSTWGEHASWSFCPPSMSPHSRRAEANKGERSTLHLHLGNRRRALVSVGARQPRPCDDYTIAKHPLQATILYFKPANHKAVRSSWLSMPTCVLWTEKSRRCTKVADLYDVKLCASCVQISRLAWGQSFRRLFFGRALVVEA